MGTPFITHLEPTRLDGYNTRLTHDKQSPHIPPAFKDAMSIREAVFVKEQGCPLEFEHDADDARSCHWVMYASVKTTVPEERDSDGQVIRPRHSETKSTPIGTLRIVPFPHPPHPPDGGRYVGGVLLPGEDIPSAAGDGGNGENDENNPPTGNGNGNGNGTPAEPRRHRAFSLVDQRRLSAPMPFGADRRTDFHDGKEPYVKLGRVSVLSEFRGHQIAAQLWAAAKKWLLENPTYFNPSVKELGFDVMKVGSAEDIPKWNGLICIHAQENVTKIYERWGFKVDKSMGRFFEEGIPHVGMFQRLEVKSTDPKI
ncbi:acetyltransferase [Nemania abortiva]|nr:acetyltransferase [Nemania abortiva]